MSDCLSLNPQMDATALVVADIGRTVLTAGDAIDQLALETEAIATELTQVRDRTNRNTDQILSNAHQIREQGYHVSVLCETMQALLVGQHESIAAMNRLQSSLDRLSHQLGEGRQGVGARLAEQDRPEEPMAHA